MLERAEGCGDGRPRAGQKLFSVAALHDGAEAGHPRRAHVADVPDQTEDAAGLQDASHLGGCRDHIDPVPRLTQDDGVDALIGKVHAFRGADQRLHGRKGLSQGGEHRGIRFHGDHVGPRIEQRGGELSGTRPDIRNARMFTGGASNHSTAAAGYDGRPVWYSPPPSRS
jgi:hypothetical protein